MKNPMVSGSFARTFSATSTSACRIVASLPFFARMIAVIVNIQSSPVACFRGLRACVHVRCQTAECADGGSLFAR
jgi:hypothetical protein